MAARSGPPPVLVNKVLLAHSHARLFTHCLWLLSRVAAELRSCNRDHMASKA